MSLQTVGQCGGRIVLSAFVLSVRLQQEAVIIYLCGRKGYQII